MAIVPVYTASWLDEVGEQRQRVNIVGRHAVRGGDQTGGRLSDGGVVAIADVVRFDAAGQERGGRGRVGERQSAVDPLCCIGQRFGVRSQGLQPALPVGNRLRRGRTDGEQRRDQNDGHQRHPARRGSEEVDDRPV